MGQHDEDDNIPYIDDVEVLDDDGDEITIDGITMWRTKGSCETCVMLHDPGRCFQVEYHAKHKGCYGGECWKLAEKSDCNASASLIPSRT